MKKFIAVFALFFAFVACTFAQTAPSSSTESTSATIRPGRNVVKFRNGSTLMFMARGTELSNLELRTAAGQVIKLDDDDCSTCGNTQPPKPCNGELVCSYSQKYQTTICWCRPKLDIKANTGGGTNAAVDFFLKIDGVPGESK